MVKIAVEHPFTSVQKALVKKGYNAEMLEDKYEAMDYDCVVVRNKEDLADFRMNVPLVEATGRTLFEIVEEVEERLVRSNKISEPVSPTGKKKSGMSGGAFIAGAATGALVGAAASLMLTPKSGKEMQEVVKEKASGLKGGGGDENGGGLKEKATGALNQVKEKAAGLTSGGDDESGGLKEKAAGALSQAKDKSAELATKAKAPVDKVKAKREEKKEEKELKEQHKVVENEIKEEKKAHKEHEKAEKKVEKEQKKAEKEAGGKPEVKEMGKAEVNEDSSGNVKITPANDKDKDK